MQLIRITSIFLTLRTLHEVLAGDSRLEYAQRFDYITVADRSRNNNF